MERRIKLVILLIAFFADMWVWDSRVDSLINQFLFIIVFLAAPLIWCLAMDLRAEARGFTDNETSIIKSIRRLLPQLIIIVLIFLVIISEVISRLEIGSPWVNTIYMVVLVGYIGFLWNLVIRDLEVGE